MTMIKVDPFRGFDTVVRRMGDVFDDIQRGGIRFEVGDFNPRVDVANDANGLTIHAELPGMEKSDVKITITDGNVLTIRGEKKREEQHKEKNFMRVERSFGSFARSFTLPDGMRTDAVNASFENGVLTITIPKTEPVAPQEQEISIQ
jgi:HSP20 family protein